MIAKFADDTKISKKVSCEVDVRKLQRDRSGLKHVLALDTVRKKLVRLIRRMDGLSYEERLGNLGLELGVRGDLVETTEITKVNILLYEDNPTTAGDTVPHFVLPSSPACST
eukprot:g28345.t1